MAKHCPRFDHFTYAKQSYFQETNTQKITCKTMLGKASFIMCSNKFIYSDMFQSQEQQKEDKNDFDFLEKNLTYWYGRSSMRKL